MSKGKSDLIFYHNAEPHKPKLLADTVKKELKYFERFLLKAEKSMSIERYKMGWEKDEDITYSIYPTKILEIDKPKNRIKLKVDRDKFSKDKGIMNENGEKINYETFEYTDEGVILILPNSKNVAVDEEIYYGFDKVEWESLYSGFTGKMDYLEDRSGRKYKIKRKEEKANFYRLHIDCKENLRSGTDLFINGVKVEYRLNTVRSLKGIKLYDKNGLLKYSIEKEHPEKFIIRVGRKIKGKIKDNNDRLYNRRLYGKNKDKGVWIKLKDADGVQTSSENDQRTQIELFFELVFAAMDFEVWETTRPYQNDKKIKIKKTDRDENRLLLEREPKTDYIYPPKNTYQISRQKNAVQTLMFQPSPSHRNLLRLFEPKDKVEWPEPIKKSRSLNWEFLTDESREGNDQQREFVLKAMNTPDFAILEGPPGSGKTTAITELIYQLLSKGKRILLCASTHVAVDNVLEMLEEKYRDVGGPMENGVVPLRIGREESVSQDAENYRIEKRMEKFEKQLSNRSWYKKSNDSEKKKFVEEALVNSSNLVCGTTIGILQYPRFKKEILKDDGGTRKTNYRQYVIPEFDYLIIDEASKTTFQEFLVPAIYAKKWILVGDIRQLSPYTDTLHVRVNLDGILRNKAKERALVVLFKLLCSRDDVNVDGEWISPPKYIYVDSSNVISQIGKILPKKFDRELKHRWGIKKEKFSDNTFALISNKKINIDHKQIEVINKESIKREIASLFDKDIIFLDKKIYRDNIDYFPPTHIIIHPNSGEKEKHKFRHLHWYTQRGDGKYAYRSGKNTIHKPYEIVEDVEQSVLNDWGGELSWRMKRVHELEMAKSGGNKSSKEFYGKMMYALMPPDGGEFYHSKREIKKIGQISLTSVLSNMQKGVSQDFRDEKNKSVMSHGFPDLAKEHRFAKLSYQHRMHPDISDIPRELFYDGEALKDDYFISKEGREWDYNEYISRVVWLDVYKSHVYRNSNEKEAKAVLSELEKFIKWAKKQDDEYRVILLSFYEGQRKLVRDLLRKKYPENGRRETRFNIGELDVRNYTVDRVQGREGDVVFLSMVQNSRVGFMDSPNRLNVALTRAKYQLVIVGDNYYYRNQKNSFELRKIAEKIDKIKYRR